MVLYEPGSPLVATYLERPIPSHGELLIQVAACGVCRTDLHIIDGELPMQLKPLILGHQIVGEVVEAGAAQDAHWVGKRVGVPWLWRSCGLCHYCQEQRENLCERALFTGYSVNGGFAEFTVARSDFVIPIPESYSNVAAAPLLCAGAIGYRAYKLAGKPKRVGFYGFGASAHLLCQYITSQGGQVFAFTRPNDERGQSFALELGAVWAGAAQQSPPEPLDAAIIFAADGALVPVALKAIKKGGRVVCAGIHMSPIPSFEYRDLWGERSIQSVANLTREDGLDFVQKSANMQLRAHINQYELRDANRALNDLRSGAFKGSAVLVMH